MTGWYFSFDSRFCLSTISRFAPLVKFRIRYESVLSRWRYGDLPVVIISYYFLARHLPSLIFRLILFDFERRHIPRGGLRISVSFACPTLRYIRYATALSWKLGECSLPTTSYAIVKYFYLASALDISPAEFTATRLFRHYAFSPVIFDVTPSMSPVPLLIAFNIHYHTF